MGALRALRDLANKGIEQARNDKTIGASLEAKIVVHAEAGTSLASALEKYVSNSNGVDELKYILLTSGVEVVGTAEEAKAAGSLASIADTELKCTVGVANADGAKCERCWHFSTDIVPDGNYPGTCVRCINALTEMKFAPVTLKPVDAELAVEEVAA